MKISENDLTPSVLEKLNKLNKVISTETSNASFVAYRNGEFVNREYDEAVLRAVFNEDDINTLTDHLYRTENNYISAYDRVLVDNSSSYSTAQLLNSIQSTFGFQTSGKILKFKIYEKYFLILDNTGIVYRISKENANTQEVIDIVKIISQKFISAHFTIHNITDVCLYEDKVLVGTDQYGIFELDLLKEEYELKFKELDVRSLELLNNKTLLVTKSTYENNIVLFSLEINKKINTYNHLGKFDSQLAQDFVIDKNSFYVLGRTRSVNQSSKVLHIWQLDKAKIDYINIDHMIHENKEDSDYRFKFVRTDESEDGHIYLFGTKKNKLFVLDYSKRNLAKEPIELVFDIEDISIDSILDCNIFNGKFYICLKNKILVLNTHFELLENYLLDNSLWNIGKITTKGVYVAKDKEIARFSVPAKKYQKVTDVIISNNNLLTNNIDLLVKLPESGKIIFVNPETKEEITPFFYMKLNQEFHVIKLINLNIKTVIMRIGCNEQDQIGGIVIHKNRIFYK